jgi:hypothetical protein
MEGSRRYNVAPTPRLHANADVCAPGGCASSTAATGRSWR